MPDILLKKWYLDCVDEQGRTFIGYSAEAQWRSVHFHFQSYMFYSPQTGIITGSSLLGHAFPFVTGESIEWNSKPLGISGMWASQCPPIHRDLSATRPGSMTWDCYQPLSDVTVRIGDSTSIQGTGYVECLEIQLTEWYLPFNELRWGRFLSGTTSLVWIDWIGGSEQRLLFWNGEPVDRVDIDDERIVIPHRDARLTFPRHTILKDASILSPQLKNIPGLSSVIPSSLAQSREIKWLSRGTLQQHAAPDLHGWTIHERVVFR